MHNFRSYHAHQRGANKAAAYSESPASAPAARMIWLSPSERRSRRNHSMATPARSSPDQFAGSAARAGLQCALDQPGDERNHRNATNPFNTCCPYRAQLREAIVPQPQNRESTGRSLTGTGTAPARPSAPAPSRTPAARAPPPGSPRPSSPSPTHPSDQRKHHETSQENSLPARGTGSSPAPHAGPQHARNQELPTVTKTGNLAPTPKCLNPVALSSDRYTESELPTSFGPKTGTPEEGVDDTFILYAGPKTGHLRPSAQAPKATKVRNTSW